MAALLLLMQLWVTAPAHALTYDEIQPGMTVELNTTTIVNRILSGANLMCRIRMKTYYPKVTIGPEGDVKARYFTVISKATDPMGYDVYLTSEQMPCGCTLHLTRFAHYFSDKEEFSDISAADAGLAEQEPPIPSSCANLPEWTRKEN